ncbi:hypothetical protein K7X08_011025 [Anisodus acutangulus]|uniref:Complex III subunit VI n=1 Tax=Anisodus acutangulus TaxID=402998 RepID=A0A9Q1M1Z4_9SOLA|nr:hypothetical protein K7X08_011025 [Anisodus acutangulus]
MQSAECSLLALPSVFVGFLSHFSRCTNQSLHLQYIFSMLDEEVVDPKATMEVTCKPKCVRQLKEYQACTRRIEGDESGSKHCTGQYFDYWQCIDKCVAPKLFEKLK